MWNDEVGAGRVARERDRRGPDAAGWGGIRGTGNTGENIAGSSRAAGLSGRPTTGPMVSPSIRLITVRRTSIDRVQ